MAAEIQSWLKVGEKVLVKDKGLEGTVRYVGSTEFAPGYWVGVELPHASGKNAGSVRGKSYFVCAENHGLFVRPNQLDQALPEDVPSWLRVGVCVRVRDKGLEGHARFIGLTEFAPGTWVGVELPTATGKNNGTVKGKAYFSCPDDHGLFVRPPQLELAEGVEPSTPLASGSGIPMPKSLRRPVAGKRTDKSPPVKRIPMPKTPSGTLTPSKEKEPTSLLPSMTASSEELKPQSFVPPSSGGSGDSSAEVTDLQQKVAILQQKRSKDKARLKELEKYRIQYHQMVEYRTKWTESHNELQQLLKSTKKEAREALLQKESAEEELRELSDAVEMATLDKEMAEEKLEAMMAENEALKDQVQELSIDLDIIKNEISESGYEGAAASSQLKQLEHQNARLKEALVRLRDLSNQEKQEHQRLVKDFEKQLSALSSAKEQKDRLEEELKEADTLIDELKEQVDVALGAEEMVENLTDKNLQLEEELNQLTETVNDLEALRDLSEQQEELRVEVEHELREEVDLNMNTIRQLERKLDASQETIVDQQQTIEKYRELVRHLQADITELRQRPQDEGDTKDFVLSSDMSAARPDSMLTQLKSTAIKTYSRTIDFELRKMEAQQAAEMVNVLKAFMPNTFLVSGGDYDALSVMMLLPRLVFKAELIIDQLKQQTNMEEALGSLSKLKVNQHTDLLTYGSFLIYKLTSLQLMVNKVLRVLRECDVQLYRQMGSLRDDLAIHERSLDILIELLKKEELDESVPLNGIEKAIHHLELLLQTRLTHTSKYGQNDLLLDQMKVMVNGCDFCSLELLRLRSHSPEICSFRSQLKELETFNNDVRQACRKIRRRVPSVGAGKTVVAPPELIEDLVAKHLLLVTCFRALHGKVSQKAMSLSDGEKLSNGELETFIQEVSRVVLQELLASEDAKPEELSHVLLSKMVKSLDEFLNNLQDGVYDAALPKSKPTLPMMVRAMAVKAELSDTEGLKFKLEEKQNEIIEFKKTIRLKVQEVGECNMKIGLLEKKLETADAECARKVEEQRQETEHVKSVMEQQERKFNKAMEVLQGDIEAVENERDNLKHQLETQSHVAIPPDLSGVRRSASLSGRGGRQSVAALLSRGSPLRGSRSTHESVAPPAGVSSPATVQEEPEPSPLLLAKIDALRHALSCSTDENCHMKAQIAKAKLASLPPLRVPKRLSVVQPKSDSDKQKSKEEDQENEKQGESNQTDLEKSLVKRSSTLTEDLRAVVSGIHVVDITRKTAQVGDKHARGVLSPRETLALQVASVLELRQKTAKLREETQLLMAGTYPGGTVQSHLRPFVSPQFAKVVDESASGPLLARLKLPSVRVSQDSSSCAGERRRRMHLPSAQFEALHSAIVT